MRCGNIARPSPKRAVKCCVINYGRICCSTSHGIWFPSDPTGANRAPSNAAQSPIPCSTNRDDGSSKSPTAVATGKADPAIIEALTNRHSGLTPFQLRNMLFLMYLFSCSLFVFSFDCKENYKRRDRKNYQTGSKKPTNTGFGGFAPARYEPIKSGKLFHLWIRN